MKNYLQALFAGFCIALAAALGFFVTPLAPVAIAQVGSNSTYPAGAIPLTSSATGTTAAVVATLAASPGRTTYICGFTFAGTNATAATALSVVVSGTLGGSLTYGYPTIAAGAAVPNPAALNRDYTPCVPASAVNTAIVVTGPVLGAGATLATTAATGYSLGQ